MKNLNMIFIVLEIGNVYDLKVVVFRKAFTRFVFYFLQVAQMLLKMDMKWDLAKLQIKLGP